MTCNYNPVEEWFFHCLKAARAPSPTLACRYATVEVRVPVHITLLYA
jgi:hypothetical protein